MSEYVQQKSWFSRNWLWFVPVSGCLLLILLLVFGVGAAIFGVTKIISNSTPYEYALEKARENPRVIEVLGNPIDTDGIMQGNISIKNKTGKADIKIPIEGPNGKASIVVKAEKFNDEWEYEELYVEIKGTQEQINLLVQSLEGI